MLSVTLKEIITCHTVKFCFFMANCSLNRLRFFKDTLDTFCALFITVSYFQSSKSTLNFDKNYMSYATVTEKQIREQNWPRLKKKLLFK